jgi:hypothetical protein
VTQGDVLIFEPVDVLGDDVRFETPGPSTLLFYSAKPGGSLGDTGTPTAFVTPQASAVEGPNGIATYTPTSGQPGFSLNSSFVLSYNFVSDGTAAPLPAALPLFATGIGALGLLGWRRKRKAQTIG